MIWDSFSGVVLCSLFLVKETKIPAYKKDLDNILMVILRKQLGDSPFQFQHDHVMLYKSQVEKVMDE